MTENVTSLETTQIKIKESLGSIKHNLLETNENYVKDKDQLVRAKTNITDRHGTASVRNRKNEYFNFYFYVKDQCSL